MNAPGATTLPWCSPRMTTGGHRVATAALAAGLGLRIAGGTARAHETAGAGFDAPLPLSLLFAGAGATVALTALWLAVAERRGSEPRTGAPPATPPGRRVATVPPSVAAPLRYGARGVFLGAVAAALAVGVLGSQTADNPTVAFAWPVWFRGVALVAVLAGSPWPALSPWRALYGALVRLEGRTLAAVAYPAALGAWPAAVGFVALIGVVENLTLVPRVPRLTAAAVAVYGGVTLAGALLAGPAWFRRADPLEVFYRLLGRVSVLDAARTADGGYDLRVRAPWAGCLRPVGSGSLAAFVVAMVYTVSFDGFTETRAFQRLAFAVRDGAGTGAGTGVVLYLVGLAAFLAAFALVVRVVGRLGGDRGGTGPCGPGDTDADAPLRRRNGGTDRRPNPSGASLAFAPTVLPIAAAYEVAHNYPYVLRNAGRLAGRAAAPLAGSGAAVDPLWWLSLPAFWASQVALIVLGHVVAVVAAHRVAAARYGDRTGWAHLPLVALMVGYTVLSLWIVSRPIVAG